MASCSEDTTGPQAEFGNDSLTRYTAYSDAGNPWSFEGGTIRGDGIAAQSVLVRNGETLQAGWLEIEADSIDDGGLVLGFLDNNNYFLLAIRDDGALDQLSTDNLQIYRRSGPGAEGFHTVWKIGLIWTRGDKHVVRFEAAEDVLRVYFDGYLKGVVGIGAPLPPGGFGIRHNGDSFDAVTRYRQVRWSKRL